MGAEHVVTIEEQQATRLSVPFLFVARCSCGSFGYGPNAPKWTLLAIQAHYVKAGLTNDRGVLRDESAEPSYRAAISDLRQIASDIDARGGNYSGVLFREAANALEEKLAKEGSDV